MLVAEIPLTQGRVAIVDDEDYVCLSAYSWNAAHINGYWYAVRNSKYDENWKRRQIRMHREVVGAPDGLIVDHINHNTLDNRRSNLRVCTKAENGRNLRSRGVSRYLGVSPIGRKWAAQIGPFGSKRLIGYFDDEVDAALAADMKAIRVYGEFANPNFLRA